MCNLIADVESNLFGQAAQILYQTSSFSYNICKTILDGKSEKRGIIMADVPGARRIIFVAISDIEGDSQWGAQYDASLPPKPARETIWKCLHSLGNHSKNMRKKNIIVTIWKCWHSLGNHSKNMEMPAQDKTAKKIPDTFPKVCLTIVFECISMHLKCWVSYWF